MNIPIENIAKEIIERRSIDFTEVEGRGGKGLDEGIAPFVRILWDEGINTWESCESGEGHPHPEPIIYFSGGFSEGFKAASIALRCDLPVSELRRFWNLGKENGIEGPHWAITFWRKANAEEIVVYGKGEPRA